MLPALYFHLSYARRLLCNILIGRLWIGDIVATDAVPIKAYGANYDSVHLFIDALSGFCTIIFGHKTDGSKELASHTERVRKQYERYGHIIKILQTDSLSAYQAAPFEDNLIKTGIQRRESAPHEHQQNRQVERYVRSMEEQVTSMRAAINIFWAHEQRNNLSRLLVSRWDWWMVVCL